MKRRRRTETTKAIYVIGPSIAYLPLTQNQFALIDSEDAENLSRWNWYACWAPSVQAFYASRREDGRYVAMSRELAEPGIFPIVDHINRRTLDNRRANLRPATYSQNRTNSRAIGIMKGVCRVGNRFQSFIKTGTTKKHLGCYATAKEAHEALLPCRP